MSDFLCVLLVTNNKEKNPKHRTRRPHWHQRTKGRTAWPGGCIMEWSSCECMMLVGVPSLIMRKAVHWSGSHAAAAHAHRCETAGEIKASHTCRLTLTRLDPDGHQLRLSLYTPLPLHIPLAHPTELARVESFLSKPCFGLGCERWPDVWIWALNLELRPSFFFPSQLVLIRCYRSDRHSVTVAW